MTPTNLLLNAALFTATLWLGLYILARDPRRLVSWLAGLALGAYALSAAFALLNPHSPSYALALGMLRWQPVLLLLPALCWLAIFWLLVPGYAAWNRRYREEPWLLLLFIGGMLVYTAAITWWIFPGRGGNESWLRALIGLDLLFLGTLLIVVDAREQGEPWLSHYFRALDYTFFTALLFGGQVALVMLLGIGINFPLLLLLLGVLSTAVVVQVFADQVQTFVDRIAFAHAPWVRQERQELRQAATAAQLRPRSGSWRQLSNEEFTRQTRRALSHMGDLPRLAGSPLIELPLIDQRLAQQEVTPPAAARTLARAAVLKQLLAESIAQLKPRGPEPFGTTAEWRYYNALYFPYVAGIRPYRRHPAAAAEFPVAEHIARQVLSWFEQEVPPRTLYNWQNKGAALIARDLRDQLRAQPSPALDPA